jgi:transposase-like protein
MCAPCSHIEIGRRDIAGHRELMKDGPANHPGLVVFQRYLCTACGTKWLHENDSGDPDFGWDVAE